MKYGTVVQEWKEQEEKIRQQFTESLLREEWHVYDLDYIGKRFGQQAPKYKDLSPICQRCIFQHIHKYKDFLHDGSPMGMQFQVPCKGIPKEYIPQAVFEHIGVREGDPEYDELLALKDPVAWSRLNCFTEDGQPWIARPIQEEVLRCTSRRKVLRLGRRMGKSSAIIADTLFYSIMLPNQPTFIDADGEERTKPLHTLIITPRQSHSDNLWAALEANIANSPTIRESLDGKPKKNPYIKVKFKNGSRITIMTAGTGTSAAGLSIRSFSADRLVLDEANYLGEAELKAARAILATNKNCTFLVASTPKGVQDFFWRWCFGSPGYREFYAPTPALPHWQDIQTEIFQDCATLDEFLQEYMALFSAPEDTVFRMNLIQAAQKKYFYNDLEPQQGWLYSIGVDWNSNAGTEIIIAGLEPSSGQYMIVGQENISKSEWTQLKACEKLVELNRIWKPVAICVDRGYGHTQIEVLRAFASQAFDEVDRALLKNLVPYDFGSTLEMKDPAQMGKTIKKHAKPFLVRNAVSLFEEERVWISAFDTLLIQQLNIYAIKSISTHGTPIFHAPDETIGDHRLDAMMLSLMGFRLKLDRTFQSLSEKPAIGFLGTSMQNFGRTLQSIKREQLNPHFRSPSTAENPLQVTKRSSQGLRPTKRT